MSVIKLSEENLLKSKIEEIRDFEDSFFSDCYKQAYKSLVEIYNNCNDNNCDDKNKNDDDYNNIIAFVGDRGSGKTSTMRSFSKSLDDDINKDNKYLKKILQDDEINILQNSKFHVLDIIDPSLFSNRDSLVEIIVSNMFRKFKGNKKNNDLLKKQALVKQFEKVFEEIKTVNMDKQSIFHECNDNIERLMGLSAALDLKEDLKTLIDLYIKYISDECNKKQFLVVSIDDIDMNLEVGRYLLEDIRKYLIQRNIILLMAVNFDQLEEIIAQKFVIGLNENFRFQHDIYEQDKKEGYKFLADFKNKIDEKTEKYLDKLIPYNRRCFMPTVDLDAELELIDGLQNLEHEDSNKLEDIIKLNFENKLNYKIESENHKRTLIPKNLRALIQLLILLNSMKNYDIKNNLKQIITYYKEVLIKEVENRQDQLFLQDILKCYYKDMNRKILIYLNTKIRDEIEDTFELKDIKDDLDYIDKNKTLIFGNRITLGDVITWIKLYDRVQFNNNKSRFIETCKSIYTIRLLYIYYDKYKEYMKDNEIIKSINIDNDEEINQEKDINNEDIIRDIIGKDIIGKFFYITDNKNSDKINKVVSIKGQHKYLTDRLEDELKIKEKQNQTLQDRRIYTIGNDIEQSNIYDNKNNSYLGFKNMNKNKMEKIMTYFVNPIFDDTKSGGKIINNYKRLIRREDKSYYDLIDFSRFTNFDINPFNLIVYSIINSNNYNNIDSIINIDYFMKKLDESDKVINNVSADEKLIVNSIKKVLEKFLFNNLDQFNWIGNFLEKFYKNIYPEILYKDNQSKNNILREVLKEIDRRIDYIYQPKRNSYSTSTLLKTINIIFKNYKLFDFDFMTNVDLTANINEFSNIFSNMNNIERGSEQIKNYTDWLLDIQQNIIETYPNINIKE